MARKSSTKKKTAVRRRPRASKAAEPTQEKAAQPRRVSRAELEKILAAHQRWLQSKGKQGKGANLRDANLQEALLLGDNLQKAILEGANLQKANLLGAKLQGALRYSDLGHRKFKELKEDQYASDMVKSVMDH